MKKQNSGLTEVNGNFITGGPKWCRQVFTHCQSLIFYPIWECFIFPYCKSCALFSFCFFIHSMDLTRMVCSGTGHQKRPLQTTGTWLERAQLAQPWSHHREQLQGHCLILCHGRRRPPALTGSGVTPHIKFLLLNVPRKLLPCYVPLQWHHSDLWWGPCGLPDSALGVFLIHVAARVTHRLLQLLLLYFNPE